MRFVKNISPVAISATGRDSSGVGLTAAIAEDSETRQKRLEPQAMCRSRYRLYRR